MLGHPRYSELVSAIYRQDENEIIALLKNNSINPNDCGLTEEPALFAAVKTGNPKIVALLLDYNADPFLSYQNMSAHTLATNLKFTEIASMLPRVKPQDWLLMRLRKMDINVPKVGVCFTMSYLSMLWPEDLLVGVLHELRKISLSSLKRTFKRAENTYHVLLQQVKTELPEDQSALMAILTQYQVKQSIIDRLNDESLRQVAAKLIQNNLLNKLDRKTFYVLHAMWMFNAIKLMANADSQAPFIAKEAWYQPTTWQSFTQEKYIHQTLNYIMPISLLYAGGLRCVAHYSGIYHEHEVLKSFEDLQHLIDNSGLKQFLALIIKGTQHTLHYKFNPGKSPTLMNINCYPVFLSKPATSHVFSTHLGSKNNITTFSTLIYATGEDDDSAKEIIASWQASSFWRNLHELSKYRMNLKTSHHETWYNISESGGNLQTFRALAKNNKEEQFVQRGFAFALAFVLANLLINNSQNKLEIGASLLISVLLYLAINRGCNYLGEIKTRYIGTSFKQFNEHQGKKAAQINILKIAKNPDVFFQLTAPKDNQSEALGPNFSP